MVRLFVIEHFPRIFAIYIIMKIFTMYSVEFRSEVNSVFFINSSPVGEGGRFGAVIPQCRFLLSVHPLGSGDRGMYLPFSRILDFSDGNISITENDGFIELDCLPGGAFIVSANPPCVPPMPDKLPHILTSLDFTTDSKQMRAVVYFDRTVNIALEDGFKKVLWARSLGSHYGEYKLFFRNISGLAVIIAEMGARRVVVSVVRPEILIDENFSSFEISEGFIHAEHPLDGGCGLRRKFSASGGKLVAVTSEIRTAPDADIAKTLAYCIYYGDQKTAKTLLSPSLASLEWEQLCGFFGDFSEVAPGVDFALRYKISENIYDLRRFELEFEDGAIGNIEEID